MEKVRQLAQELSVISEEEWKEIEAILMQKQVDMILNKIGIQTNLKGYQFLETAIMYAMTEDLMESHSDPLNVLYTVVGKKHKTTQMNVERSIRYAVEKAWTYGDVDIQNKIFGYTIDYNRSKPINTHVVITLAQYCANNMIKVKEICSAVRILSNITEEQYNLISTVSSKISKVKSDNEQENLIIDLLKDMGFPTHYKGYNLIKSAVSMTLKDETILTQGITKGLYPLIAKMYGITPEIARMRMNNTIKVALKRGNSDVYIKVFGSAENLDRISNSELVHGLVLYLKKM